MMQRISGSWNPRSTMWMRAFPMCFSLLRAPRHGIHALSSLWQDSLHRTSKTHGSHWRFNVISPKPNELEGRGYSRRWTRSATTLNDTRQQQLAERKDLHKLLTVIVFDIETTGFKGQFNRIVEIAFRDLGGGENSTFETLVYPERPICNSYFHGINDDMVMKDGVPRMEELIPIMVQYIESRRKQDGHVLLVAHNGRSFDVPFLKCEFERCNFQIPADWFFYDSLRLARKLFKSASLGALVHKYKIELVGKPHRAMADVNALSEIVPKLTHDLEISIADLVKDSFTVSELSKTSSKKKGPASKAKSETSEQKV